MYAIESKVIQNNYKIQTPSNTSPIETRSVKHTYTNYYTYSVFGKQEK